MTAHEPYRVIPRKLPSLKKQAALCLFALIAFPAAAIASVHFLGDARDAVAGGVVALAEMPAPVSVFDLDAAPDGGNLPDILNPGEQAQVTIIEPQPQSQIDILGNGGTDSAAPGGLAGSVPAPNISASRPQGTPPVQATIDGRPIDSIPQSGTSSSPVPGRFLPATTQTGPLPAAPLPGLSRMTPFGQVPVKGPGGRVALTSYAKPFTPPASGNTVSIIIGGLGINATQTQRAINDLPPQITLSFASQAAGLQSWINQARAKGHEVLLELPMEPYNFDASAPGARYTVRSDGPAGSNIRNLDYLMSRAQGYFAVTNYLGERFFDSETAMGPVTKHISDAGVGFIYDGIGKNAALDRAARSAGLTWVQNKSVIDANPSANAITQTLQALERSGSSARPALGMGFSYPATIDAVQAWTIEAQKRGVILAPASYALMQGG